MNKKTFFILQLLFFIVLLIFLPKKTFGFENIVFHDDFNDSIIDTSKWEYFGSNAIEDSGYLKLFQTSSKNFPFIFNKQDIFPSQGDYYIQLRFRFPQSTVFGVGIVLGNSIPPYGIDQSYIFTHDSDIMQFNIWQSITDRFLNQTLHCTNSSNCDINRANLAVLTPDQNEHVVRIEMIGNMYKYFIDGNEVLNDALLNTTKRPTHVSFGNPITADDNLSWTELWVDDIETGQLISENNTVRSPVVILPGLGASWDLDALLSGGVGSNWKIPDFIKTYNNLQNTFVNLGYEKDKDLFVFPYDWRKPLKPLANDLKNYIDGLVTAGKITSTDQLILIGHSYGGLVARTYAQVYSTDKIKNLVMVGSPNYGVLDAYGVWEGGKLWSDNWWQKAALDITSHLNQAISETKVDVIRRVAPGFKDLLPVYYPYLIKQDTSRTPLEEMYQQNETLSWLWSGKESISNKTIAFFGTSFPTKESLNIEERTAADQIAHAWEDGRPALINPLNYSDGGDGTVLTDSAVGGLQNSIGNVSNHGGLISNQEPISSIVSFLGFDSTKVIATESLDERKDFFSVILRSPGILYVCNPNNVCNENLGIYDKNLKLFIAPDPVDSKFVVRVEEGGIGQLGDYKLHFGKSTGEDSVWKVLEGSLVSAGQIDNYDVDAGSGLIVNKRSVDIVSEINTAIAGLISCDKTWKGVKLTTKSYWIIRTKLAGSLDWSLDKRNQTCFDKSLTTWKMLDKYAEETEIGPNYSPVASKLTIWISDLIGHELSRNKRLKDGMGGVIYKYVNEEFKEAKDLLSSNKKLALNKLLSLEILILRIRH